jgi:hypothetical protein
MLSGLRSRLTYANVMATVAVFLALGGGAYALSGIPDGGGVYHACVASSGALRVVTKASSCLKARTVKRGKRRVRIPGESAIAWNQQGLRGIQGGQGPQGQQGGQGQNGAAGATKVVVRSSTNTTTTNAQNVTCSAGEMATGGGGDVTGSSLIFSHPTPNSAGSTPTGWQAFSSSSVGAGNLTANVVCASP